MLEIPITYEIPEEGDCSPEYEYPPRPSLSMASKTDSAEGDSKKVYKQTIQLCQWYLNRFTLHSFSNLTVDISIPWK
jgi:hypothetical protein